MLTLGRIDVGPHRVRGRGPMGFYLLNWYAQGMTKSCPTSAQTVDGVSGGGQVKADDETSEL